ncbi:MAG: uncharacterized protein A8A55_2487 [Amphiamblys sp. WSBS2006]|nr:MAG: uncharacterized protein A8A55_2487 [Amphiamblys sp. WSBS2006]
MEYLKGRKDKREVVCPYCREKKSDKAYQKEILGILFSRIPHQTLHSLELRPDTEVKTVTKLTRETKVVLSNITISDNLFFKLMARTSVEITNVISLVGHDNSLGRCLGEFYWKTRETVRFCFDECTNEEMKQVCSNIKTMPRKGIHINAKEIHAKENGVYFLLKAWTLFDTCSPDLFLKTSKKEHIEEFLEEEDSSLWIGNAKCLDLGGYAVGILPKLGLSEENEIEKLSLDSDGLGEISEIPQTKNNSIWVGRVKRLRLCGSSVEILPKLRLHYENVMEKLELDAYDHWHIHEILKTENNSICLGKVQRLELRGYAMGILPKLKIHTENVLEALELDTDYPEDVAEILEEENNSIWIGKVKRLDFKGYAIEILPKLRFHDENAVEKLGLGVYSPGNIDEILGKENNTIWIGKMEKAELCGYAIQILPKLKPPG